MCHGKLSFNWRKKSIHIASETRCFYAFYKRDLPHGCFKQKQLGSMTSDQLIISSFFETSGTKCACKCIQCIFKKIQIFSKKEHWTQNMFHDTHSYVVPQAYSLSIAVETFLLRNKLLNTCKNCPNPLKVLFRWISYELFNRIPMKK